MKHYTTGQVANVTGMSGNAIRRCCNDGSLNSFRVPGSKHRRITRKDLITFMDDNELPKPSDLWIRSGLKVTVLRHEDPTLIGQQGLVTAVTITCASVQFKKTDVSVRHIPLENLELV